MPGPGEPILIAAGILAADHKLDIVSVLVVAFAAASAGGIAAWLIGLKVGRTLLAAPGPLHGLRLRWLERGDEVFQRYVAIAVLVAPNVLAGIHRVRPRVYLLWNTVWALVWSVGIGLGAYYAGPPIVDLASDFGLVSTVILVLFIALVVAGVWRRRRRVTQQAL